MQFQVNRLKETHHDLLINEDTKEATLFFLNEIYSFKDLTKRDRDLERLLPTMGKLFPENTLSVIANAMVLDSLTENLETKMALAIGESVTTVKYNKAYKTKTSYEERLEQFMLVKDLGDCLCNLVKIPLVETSLKIMKFPARMANLEDMHLFLHTGFQTFKNTKNPELFIETLIKREKIILENLFNTK